MPEPSTSPTASGGGGGCGGMYPKAGSIFGHQKAMTEAQRQARIRARSVFGERWSERVLRIREQSPYGAHPRWQLHTAIVKRGDDCRQELLAVQLMYTFQSIFQDAGLPLWVRPYQVSPSSIRSEPQAAYTRRGGVDRVWHRSRVGELPPAASVLQGVVSHDSLNQHAVQARL